MTPRLEFALPGAAGFVLVFPATEAVLGGSQGASPAPRVA